MKVAYFIFSNEFGTGGHHLSLKAINGIIDLLPDTETHIINIGVSPSPLLSKSLNFRFYKINEFTLLLNFFSILYFCKKERIDVLHAFDINGYFYVRIISFLLKIPSVYNKCGGANKKYNPKSIFGIATSEENYDYLKEKKNHINLYLIENRIPFFKQNEVEINKLRNHLIKNKELLFLRIIRISNYYKDSIIKSIKFTSYFSNKILVFIGSIYDEELKNSILSYASELNVQLIFLCDSKYTSNARELIGVGDYVFGTGRTAMEIMSTKKVLLGFAKNCDYPIIVNQENFDFFRYYNFSERAIVEKIPTLNKVISFIKTENNTTEINEFLYKKFQENYLIDSKKEFLNQLYFDIINSKRGHYYMKDFFANFFHHFMRCSLIINQILIISRRLRKL